MTTRVEHVLGVGLDGLLRTRREVLFGMDMPRTYGQVVGVIADWIGRKPVLKEIGR